MSASVCLPCFCKFYVLCDLRPELGDPNPTRFRKFSAGTVCSRNLALPCLPRNSIKVPKTFLSLCWKFIRKESFRHNSLVVSLPVVCRECRWKRLHENSPRCGAFKAATALVIRKSTAARVVYDFHDLQTRLVCASGSNTKISLGK